MSYHYIIRNRWLTQMLTDMEYIEYLEDELRDKTYVDPEEFEQAIQQVDRLESDIDNLQSEITELSNIISELEDEKSNLYNEISELEAQINYYQDKYE